MSNNGSNDGEGKLRTDAVRRSQTTWLRAKPVRSECSVSVEGPDRIDVPVVGRERSFTAHA